VRYSRQPLGLGILLLFLGGAILADATLAEAVCPFPPSARDVHQPNDLMHALVDGFAWAKQASGRVRLCLARGRISRSGARLRMHVTSSPRPLPVGRRGSRSPEPAPRGLNAAYALK